MKLRTERGAMTQLAPLTAPYSQAHTGRLGLCPSCSDYHTFDSMAEQALAEIIAIGAMPFADDEPHTSNVFDATTIEEILSAYQTYMVVRLGIPAWFAPLMGLESCVSAWASAREFLCHPTSGDIVCAAEDWHENIFDPACLVVGDNDPITAKQIWGSAPVTLTAWMPLKLFWWHENTHMYRLLCGAVGGPQGRFVQVEQIFGNGLQITDYGPDIKGLLPPLDQLSIGAREALEALEGPDGANWELAWTHRG